MSLILSQPISELQNMVAMQGAVESAEREGWVRPGCPGAQEPEAGKGNSGSPRALSPRPQAPQAPWPAQDRLSWLRPLGWDVGPNFPEEESRTRPGPDPEP